MSSPARNYYGLKPIAPVWHTCCVLAMFAMLSGFSVYVRLGSTTPRIGHLLIYPIIIAFEWALFALCLWNTDSAFVGYLARVVRDPRSLRVDIPVALLIGGICFVVAPVMVRVLGNTGWVSVEGMHPDNGWEIALWMVMAISAGICEEAVFRGYFQQQFSGWSGHASVGVLGQAAVFGVGHAYQGWKNVTLIFVIGCILGVFAVLRKGLRANMIAHVIMDALAAF